MEAGPCHVGLHRRNCRQGRPWGRATLTSYRKESLSEWRPALSHPIRATKCLLMTECLARTHDWLRESKETSA
jgi:hypothetical protein